MVDFNALRRVLNGAGMSVRHTRSGAAVVDSRSFRGAKLSSLDEAQRMLEESIREDTKALAERSGFGVLDTLKTVSERAERVIGGVLDLFGRPEPVDSGEMRRRLSPVGIRDSIFNPGWNIGVPKDPTTSSAALPNIYLSPWEANSLYSQKGLFETVVNKKSKSILLNGIRVENPRLTSAELDRVNEKVEVRNVKHVIADATRDSLVYGGGIVFPLFRRDTPVTAAMPLDALLKLGVLGRDCIDFFVRLDRWNCFIIPSVNPTQRDFYMPSRFTVPFLGADVNSRRCARVVTAEQAGYWGQIINQGWGISDLCGYLQSGLNYKVAIQSLPLMIQQMSILARVVNVDGVLATEGLNSLDALVEENTIRTREASPDNPVTMDVLGDIKSINRNFQHVPELLRLLRQDFASDTTIPEPMLFSSEKGNFSSGDDTEGNQSKQWEAVKMIHKDVQRQFSQIAKILVIDALGADDRVVRALPYTRIHFDEPVIANAVERSQIGKFFSENVFNLVSAQTPLDIAFEMAAKNVSADLAPSNDVLERLKDIQARVDAQDEERFKLEMEQQRAEIQAARNPAPAAGGGRPSGGGSSGGGEKKNGPLKQSKKTLKERKDEGGYSRLEQRSHETTRVGSSKRKEKIAKSRNKSVNSSKINN